MLFQSLSDVNSNLTNNYNTLLNVIKDCVIIKSVNIYAATTLAANSNGDIYFAVPNVKGYKCILGIGGASNNGNIIPVRASNAPNADGTLVLHYKNVASSTQTISTLWCNMIFVRDL